MYNIIKPIGWEKLAFYEKIRYYGTILTKEYSDYVDKLKAKYIVKEICGEEIEIPKVIKILKNNKDITNLDINENYIIKGAHGSKFNINIKNNTSLREILILLNKYNIKYNPHKNESQYQYIEPKFFIEEKVDDYFLERQVKL